MNQTVLAPIPRWETALNGLALALALLVIWVHELRVLPVRLLLALFVFVFLYRGVMRLKRANGLKTTIGQLHQHLPRDQFFANQLALISSLVVCSVLVFLF